MTNVLTTIRDRLRRILGRPFVYVSSEWDRMAPRERRWVAGLSIAVVAVAAGLGMYLIFTSIGDLEDGNADIREALAAVAKHRDEYLEAKARTQSQESRLGSDAPQLMADIEAAAREEEVQIAESSEQPVIPAGKRWMQHAVDLKVRGIDLLSLSEFLRRVETGVRPIFFTRLSIKRRYSETDKLDVELTALAFERAKENVAAKKKPDTGGKAAKTKANATTEAGGDL